MALGFPTNPYVGETYSFGTKTYIWNGHGWAISQGASGTTVGSFTATQAASITTSTNSTSTNSGALTVTGGVGVGGNTNIGGSLNVGSSTATVGGAQIITTGTIGQIIQAGTDTAIITGTNSVIVSNTSTLQSITGRGGSTTNPISFLNTSTSSVTVAGGFIAQGGISAQSPISVTSTASSTSTTTGALTVAGGVGISGDTNIGGTVTAQQLKIADAILDSTLVLVNTTATTVIDTYLITQYRSSKYLVQIEEVGIGALAKFQVIEILLLLDNSGTVYATEYGTLTSNGIMGDFSAGLDITDSTVKLYFTPYEATNKEIVVLRTALAM
jgi:hypothetical protein